MITLIKLQFSNAYLIQGVRPILVDSGSPGEAGKVCDGLKQRGINVEDLALIIHTHVHSDHVGSTDVLLQDTDVPMTYHVEDEPLAVGGRNGKLTGTSWRGKIMANFFTNASFTIKRPDFYLEDGLRLDAYGVEGCIMHTPGHTAGSISVLLDSGEAIIGDVLMGGYMGGNIWAKRPNLHYFAENLEQVQQSVGKLLAEPVHTYYVGHGGPLNADDVRHRLQHLRFL